MARDPFRNSRALESIAKRIEDGEKEVIAKIDPILIDEHPDNAYLFGMPEEGIESLKKAMTQPDGSIVCDAPVLVWDTGDGRYLIYSGHLRRRAFLQAGGDKIPAVIRKLPDEATQRRMLLGANIYGRNINPVNSKDPIHTARQIQYMKVTLAMEGFRGSVREQLAMEFHTSGSTIQRYESFFKLPDSIQEKVQNGELPDTVAQAMGSMETEQITKAVDALEQLKLSEAGVYFTRDNALRIVSEVKKEGNVDQVVKDIIYKNTDGLEDGKERGEDLEETVQNVVENLTPKDKDSLNEPMIRVDNGEPEDGRQIAFSDQEEFQSNVLDALKNTEQKNMMSEPAEKEKEEPGSIIESEDVRREQENMVFLNRALKEMECILTSNRIYPDKGAVVKKLRYLIILAEKEIERAGAGYENSSI